MSELPPAGPPPRVGIGVPVYNGEAYLDQALSGLRAQTFEDVEIVVSDNASTDGTAEICREHAAADPRVRVVRNRDNYGFVHNFNSVFRLSRGEYFLWAAADDQHAPTYVERCVEVLDDDPSVVLACPRPDPIDGDGNPTTGVIRPGPGLPEHDYRTYTNQDGPWSADDPDPVVRWRRLMRDIWYTVQLYGLIRSDALARTGLHANHRMGDHILLAELVLHGRFRDVDEPLFLRRLHDQQLTYSVTTLRERLALTEGGAGSYTAVARTYLERYRMHAAGIQRAPLTADQKRTCHRVLATTTARWAAIRGRGLVDRLR